MGRSSITLVLMLFAGTMFAKVNRYAVFFSDKNDSPYSLDQPEEFLSERALSRRENQNISLSENDLPVNPQYLEGLRQSGAEVFFSSKWMNLAIIQIDEDQITSLLALTYVADVQLVGLDERLSSGSRKSSSGFGRTKSKSTDGQLNQLGINNLHDEGFLGSGILVAVFDSGFRGVDVAGAFDAIFDEDRLIDTYNFVLNSDDVYDLDDHGTEVLSVIGAQVEEDFLGAAPEAEFALYITEDDATEYRIEEFNWLIGAERADSVGVDIINSSLGYNTFDSPFDDYTYSDLDGNTTIVSRAADIAASKGILVVTSAGNEGNNSWGFITAPADADSVLSVGSVNSQGFISSSSSDGPSSDGQIKPEVVARGVSVSVINDDGNLDTSSGTSFSSPLIAGMAACIWSSKPEFTAMELRDTLMSIGDRAGTPDNEYGHGLPQYGEIITSIQTFGKSKLKVYPNPVEHNSITIEGIKKVRPSFTIVDIRGVRTPILSYKETASGSFSLNLGNIAPGTYFIEVDVNNKKERIKILKR